MSFLGTHPNHNWVKGTAINRPVEHGNEGWGGKAFCYGLHLRVPTKVSCAQVGVWGSDWIMGQWHSPVDPFTDEFITNVIWEVKPTWGRSLGAWSGRASLPVFFSISFGFFCFLLPCHGLLPLCHAALAWSQSTMGWNFYTLWAKISLSPFNLLVSGFVSQQWEKQARVD